MSQRPSTFGPESAKARARGIFCVLVLVFALAFPAVTQTGAAAKLLLGTSEQKAATSPPAPTAAAAPNASSAPASLAIPLPDVAARSEDLKRILREVSDGLPSPDQLSETKATLDTRSDELQSREKGTDAVLSASPTNLEIREEENYWRAVQKETAATRRDLLEWANTAQSAVQQLQAQQPQWDATLEENKATPDLGPTLDVIRQSVADLRKLTAQAQDQLRVLVNLQVRAGSQDQHALDILYRLNKAQQYQDSRLFERDSLPLWQVNQRRQEGESSDIYLTASTRMQAIRAFAGQTRGALTLLAMLLLLSLFGAHRLYTAARYAQPADAQSALLQHIARHWIGLALLPPMVGAYLLAPMAPLPLVGLVILISFIPIVLLLPPFIAPPFRIVLYCLAGVYGLSAFIAWMAFSPATKREVQFFLQLVVFVFFAVLLRPSRTPRAKGEGGARWLRLQAIRLGVLILGVSLLANLLGYVRLAQFLSVLCFYSTFIAICMLTIVRVFTLLLLEGIDRPGAQQLAAVRCHRDTIARWVPRTLQWAGVLIWLRVTADLLGLGEWVAARVRDVRDFHIAGGSASVTLGGVLGFFVILLAGYGISSSIRFLFREELLSRFNLSRGLPELFSSMLHYLLLLLVFFFAVNAGGVELNKFTVLTGALGVGVGFGLQNIVNNFISGLILQFERPIHVGDVLDVDGTTGKVTRIGIRSSTVKTFQGAEVIVPNGNFISGKVINWTLSESQRRVDLPVGVAYGSDVKLVCTLLNQAATAHEDVLTSPSPAVFFKEFADSSLNFEAQFWVMQESNTVKVKSEVALEVMRLLDEAGIEIPFPQRDLRLRAVDADAAATLLAPNGNALTTGNDRELPASLVQDEQ
ncbi:MAG: mechanosensitive ion channel domain-containing protein [Candidatus Korobacteraceae bacterium]